MLFTAMPRDLAFSFDQKTWNANVVIEPIFYFFEQSNTESHPCIRILHPMCVIFMGVAIYHSDSFIRIHCVGVPETCYYITHWLLLWCLVLHLGKLALVAFPERASVAFGLDMLACWVRWTVCGLLCLFVGLVSFSLPFCSVCFFISAFRSRDNREGSLSGICVS